nr:transglutaminase-like domain-containing protein [uncultured Anaerocolumna sp.]
MKKSFYILVMILYFSFINEPISVLGAQKVDELNVKHGDKFITKEIYQINSFESLLNDLIPRMIRKEEIPLYRINKNNKFLKSINLLNELENIEPNNSDKWNNFYLAEILDYSFSNISTFEMPSRDKDNYYLNCNLNYLTDEQSKFISYEGEQILSYLNLEASSEFEKVRSIYSYIIENLEYTYKENGEPNSECNSVYIALYYKKAVCSGYSRLLNYLLKKANIDTRLIIAFNDNSGHAWNKVKVYDKWYNTDVTWDDEGDYMDTTYFLKSNEDFKNHDIYSNVYGSNFNQEDILSEYSFTFFDELIEILSLLFEKLKSFILNSVSLIK